MSDQDLVFYFAPKTRAATILWMLEEVGTPFKLEMLSLAAGDHKKPDYLAINPMGKVPAIRHRGVVVTETGAICAYLADAFPQADLAPSPGDPKRGTYFRWMFFAAGCVEPAIADKAFQRPKAPAQSLGYGDFDSVVNAAAGAVSQSDYLLGEHFSAADLVLGSMIRYGRMFNILPERKEFTRYIDRLEARDAFKRSQTRAEELTASIAED
jgi:glutathione S-transferase